MSKISGRWIKDGTDLNLNFGSIGITTSTGNQTYQLRAASDGGMYLKDLNVGQDRLSLDTNGNFHFRKDATISGGLQVLGTTTIVNAQTISSDRIVLEHNTLDEAILVDNTTSGAAININNLSTGYSLIANQGFMGVGTTTPTSLLNLHSTTANAKGAVKSTYLGANGASASWEADGDLANVSVSLTQQNSANSTARFGFPGANASLLTTGSASSSLLIGTTGTGSLALGTNNLARITIDQNGNITYNGFEATFDGSISVPSAGFYYRIGGVTLSAAGSEAVVHGYSINTVNTNANLYHNNWVLKVRQQAALGAPPAVTFWTVNETSPYSGFSTIAVIRQNDGVATRVDLYKYSPEANSTMYFDVSVFTIGSAVFAKETGPVQWDNVGTLIAEASRESTATISTDGDFRFNFALVDSQGTGTRGEGAGIVLSDNVGSAGTYGLAGLKAYKSDSTANAYSGQLHFQTRLNGQLGKTQMVLDENGHLGIGSTQPDLQLNVATAAVQSVTGLDTYSASIGVDTGSALRFRRSHTGTLGAHAATLDAEELGKILFYGDTGVAYKNLSFIQALQTGVSTSVGSQLLFAVANSGGAPVTKMVLRETGSVGIATTVPLSTLHVQGTLQLGTSGTQVNNISGDVSLGGGSSSNLNIPTQLAVKSYVDGSAVWLRASGTLSPVTLSDSVGIGTAATSSFGSLAYRLLVYAGSNDVNVGLYSGAAGNYAGYRVGRTAEDGAFGVASIANQWITGAVPGDLCLRNSNASGNKILFSGDSGTTSVALLAGGNLGIGSTQPDFVLNVAKAGAQSNASVDTFFSTSGTNTGSVLRLRHSKSNTLGTHVATADADELGRIGFYGNTGVSWSSQLSYIGSLQSGVGTSIGGHINFATSNSGGAATEKMRLTPNGFLGVGSTSPISQIDLLANSPTLRVKSTYGAGQSSILISNDALGAGSDVQTLTMGLSGTGSGATSIFGVSIAGGPVAQLVQTTGFGFGAAPLFIGTPSGPPNGTPITSSNGAIYLGTNGVNRMSIGYSGGVGIGSTQPDLQMNIATGGAVSTVVGIDTYNSTSGLNTGSILRMRRSKSDTLGVHAATADGDEIGRVAFLIDTGASYPVNGIAYISAVQVGSGTSVGGTVSVFTANSGGAPTAKLTVTNGGRVGIATATPLAILHANGSVCLSKATAIQTSTYNMTASDFFVYANTAPGGFTVNLPAASSCAPGQVFIIKNIGGSNTLTVSRNASPGTDLIDTAATISVTNTTNPTASVARLYCDGVSTFWRI